MRIAIRPTVHATGWPRDRVSGIERYLFMLNERLPPAGRRETADSSRQILIVQVRPVHHRSEYRSSMFRQREYRVVPEQRQRFVFYRGMAVIGLWKSSGSLRVRFGRRRRDPRGVPLQPPISVDNAAGAVRFVRTRRERLTLRSDTSHRHQRSSYNVNFHQSAMLPSACRQIMLCQLISLSDWARMVSSSIAIPIPGSSGGSM